MDIYDSNGDSIEQVDLYILLRLHYFPTVVKMYVSELVCSNSRVMSNQSE